MLEHLGVKDRKIKTKPTNKTSHSLNEILGWFNANYTPNSEVEEIIDKSFWEGRWRLLTLELKDGQILRGEDITDFLLKQLKDKYLNNARPPITNN